VKAVVKAAVIRDCGNAAREDLVQCFGVEGALANAGKHEFTDLRRQFAALGGRLIIAIEETRKLRKEDRKLGWFSPNCVLNGRENEIFNDGFIHISMGFGGNGIALADGLTNQES
jgi:hypothetical protein